MFKFDVQLGIDRDGITGMNPVPQLYRREIKNNKIMTANNN